MEDTGLRCIECDYNLTGVTGALCPECGWVIDWDRLAGNKADVGGEPTFSFDFVQRLHGGNLTAAMVDVALPSHPLLEPIIERTWNACVADAKASGQLLFNGLMVRLVDWRRDGDSIVLRTGRTDYRRFMGTNFCHGDLVDRFGIDTYANALGTSALVFTADGYLVMGRRSDKLPCHGGYLHPVGGTLDDQDIGPDGSVDLFAAIRREIVEELAVAPNEIGEMVCTGMVRDLAIHQPELLFDAQLAISRDELLRRFDADAEHQEHVRLETCFDDPDSVIPFLTNATPVAPIAQAALLVHGRHDWGVHWYEQASLRLFRQLPPRTSLPTSDEVNAQR